jgi:hypothetical protein
MGSVELREELSRLRRYVASFASSLRGRPDPKMADGIRQRIQREVDRVRDMLAQHTGADHDELVGLLEQAATSAPLPVSPRA